MNNQKVYIVEDEMGIRLLLTEIIKQAGFDVKSFEGAEQALHAINVEKPDMIFVDYMIGSVSGSDFIEQLQSQGLMIPTVVMSGHAMAEVKKSFKQLTVDYYLEKPFTVEQVQQILKSIPANVI